MTAALYQKASRSSTGAISLRAFVEGPYGGVENMRLFYCLLVEWELRINCLIFMIWSQPGLRGLVLRERLFWYGPYVR